MICYELAWSRSSYLALLACLAGDAVSKNENMCSESFPDGSCYLSYVCVNVIHAHSLLTSTCQRRRIPHAMVIAHIAVARATRRHRAASSHHSQAHQAHCRITSFAFPFEAGSPECEVFAFSTYPSSTCGAPFHRRAPSDTSYATKVHLAVVYSGGLCHTSYSSAVLPESCASDGSRSVG
jgi:hypothetical protein